MSPCCFFVVCCHRHRVVISPSRGRMRYVWTRTNTTNNKDIIQQKGKYVKSFPPARARRAETRTFGGWFFFLGGGGIVTLDSHRMIRYVEGLAGNRSLPLSLSIALIFFGQDEEQRSVVNVLLLQHHFCRFFLPDRQKSTPINPIDRLTEWVLVVRVVLLRPFIGSWADARCFHGYPSPPLNTTCATRQAWIVLLCSVARPPCQPEFIGYACATCSHGYDLMVIVCATQTTGLTGQTMTIWWRSAQMRASANVSPWTHTLNKTDFGADYHQSNGRKIDRLSVVFECVAKCASPFPNLLIFYRVRSNHV